MCSPYLFIRLHTSLLFPSLLIRANTRARKSHNKNKHKCGNRRTVMYVRIYYNGGFSMDKYIYDDKMVCGMNCKEIIIFLVLFTSRKRTTYRFVGAAAFAVSERTSQKYIHNATYKRQTEHLPCRYR